MLILNIDERQVVTLTRDGVELGTLHVAARSDGRIRIALDFPRDIQIWRAETAADILASRRRKGDIPPEYMPCPQT